MLNDLRYPIYGIGRGRAQFSLDLIIVGGIMLLLFLSLFQFYSSKAETAKIIRAKASAKEITEVLGGRIAAVLQAGNGSAIGYPLPASLADGEDYSISVRSRRVEISAFGSTISSLIPTSDVLPSDLNARKGSTIFIRNDDGTITMQ